jgi:hypothetical protein
MTLSSLVQYVGFSSQAMPLFAVVATRGRHPPAPYRQLAFLCLAFLLSDVAMLIVHAIWRYNLWVTWFTQPLEVALTLWLLSYWQPVIRLSRIYRNVIPVAAAATAILLVVTDPSVTFDEYIGPLLSLVALVGSLHTLVHRSLRSRGLLPSQDWFWICAGLSLFWLLYVPVDAFVEATFGRDEALAALVHIIRTGLMPVPFLLMTWGVLCRRFQPASSGLS